MALDLFLPPELVHQIFAILAASSTQGCLSLTLVSSWARDLSLPHLYKSPIVERNGAAFCKTLALELRPVAGLVPTRAALVKNLWMPLSMYGDLPAAFKACVNLENLAMGDPGLVEMLQSPILGDMSSNGDLSVLVTDRSAQSFEVFDYSHFGERWQKRIKYLQVSDAMSWARFRSFFSGLTRLAMPLNDGSCFSLDSVIGWLNDDSPCLEMLVAMIYCPQDTRIPLPMRDPGVSAHEVMIMKRRRDGEPRLFVLRLSYNDVHKSWRRETMGYSDIWERAIMYTNFLAGESK